MSGPLRWSVCARRTSPRTWKRAPVALDPLKRRHRYKACRQGEPRPATAATSLLVLDRHAPPSSVKAARNWSKRRARRLRSRPRGMGDRPTTETTVPPLAGQLARPLNLHVRRRLMGLKAAVGRRRRALVCAAALTTIAALSSLTAVVLWDATVDRRVELSGGSSPVADEIRLEKAAPQRRDGSTEAASSDHSTARPPESAGTSRRAPAPASGGSTSIPVR